MCIKSVDISLKRAVKLIRPSFEDLGIFLASLVCLFLGAFEGLLALGIFFKDVMERIEKSFPENHGQFILNSRLQKMFALTVTQPT